MGRKTDRLCSRHRWIPVLVMAFIWFLLLLLSLEEWSGWILVPMVFCMTLSLLMGSASTIRLMNPTVKFLQDQCDPHPMLEEATYQLSYVKNRSDRTFLSINRCAGLIEAGYYDQALEELEALDIHNPAVTTQWRHAYYHNLTVAAIESGHKEKAEVYYQSALQQVAGLKGKMRETAGILRIALSADICLMHGNYAQAYELLAPLTPEHLQGQVNRAYALAQIAVAQGQPDVARVHLDFVLTYGNRLHVVVKAQKVLEEINVETPSK